MLRVRRVAHLEERLRCQAKRLKALLLLAIRFYQRFISPRKGFRCAYRAYTGCASCSALGYRAIRRHGAWRGLAVLNGRLKACGAVYRQAHPPATPINHQAGFCDLSCDLPCDHDMCSCAGDILTGCDGCGSCDGWPGRRSNSQLKVDKRLLKKRQGPLR
jgi:uncharacterized protein